MLRRYLKQSEIPNFDQLDWFERRSAVQQYRNRELLRLQKVGSGPYRQARKNYNQTKAYIHLTYCERLSAINDVFKTIIRDYGVLIHDNNQSVAKKHTALMRHFHKSGTLWTSIDNIIETLFVDSSLTRMVQMAGLCAVALRRYCENNNNEDLFRRIFPRADRFGGRTVGVRHLLVHLANVKFVKPIDWRDW